MGTVSDFLNANKILYKATTSPATHDFYKKVVQFDDDPNLVASGEASLLLSGPPIFKDSLGTGTTTSAKFAELLVPIGTVQGIQEGGTNTVIPFREVGSKLKRLARGSADYRVTIGKILTYHSNLAHAFYAWMAISGQGLINPVDTFLLPPGEKDPNTGGHSHLTTLDSELFGLPFGLMLVTITSGGQVCSKEYWEKCLIADMGKSVNAGQPLVQEQVSLIISRKVAADGVVINTGIRESYTLSPGNTTIKSQ